MNSIIERLPTVLTRSLRAMRSLLRATIRVFGVLGVLMVLLAFTSLPWQLHRWFGTAAGTCDGVPLDVVVVLGGSGMPSGPELLRLEHASTLATAYPGSRVVVVHPVDSLVMERMLSELQLRGVDEGRLLPVLEGLNTREQALVLMDHLADMRNSAVAIVTAPENGYRSVKTFRRAGFTRVCGSPAWDTPMFIDLRYDHRRLGGRPMVPDVGWSHTLRYDLWNRLELQITCLREMLAIGYYGVNGWL